jgi:hypothetical protein
MSPRPQNSGVRAWFAGICLILVAAFAPRPAAAWGAEGHDIIARLAYERLTPRARAEVDDLIRHSPEQDTPSCPVSSPEAAATWPDCVRRLHGRFDAMAPLHYEDRPICGSAPREITCPDGRCVTAAIERAIPILKDKRRPPAERLMALEQIEHFVGDMHQPLHTGDLADKGGTATHVALPGRGRGTTLHHVWDEEIVRAAVGRDEASAEERLKLLIAANAAQWSRGDVESWFRQSHELAASYAYGKLPKPPTCGRPPGDQNLTPEYLSGAAPLVRLQLARAAVRLAVVLNTALN